MDRELLERQLWELPLEGYFFIDPGELEFSGRVRLICERECPRYGKTWACPPAVGTVEQCRARCLGYGGCLMIVTAAKISDIGNIAEALATRGPHEDVTNRVGRLMEEQGAVPYILSTESCAVCDRCAYPQPCRHPGKMHPCVESHGINLVPAMEKRGLELLTDRQTVTWVSLLFY